METKEQYMVTPVMDFAETVKTVEKMKKNAEANVAFANQLKANIVELQKITAHDLVVHNGKVLVKVERKAREGDFVVFEGLNSSYTVNGDFYETYKKDGAICYTATDNDCYTVYGWGNFCETTKVYEVIGNLPQSNEVVFEPLPIENGTKIPCNHLTANQKRARAILMAKNFVEKAIEDARDIDDDILVPDSKGNVFAWNCREIRFKINTEKRTVVALAIGAGDGSVVERAIAKCHVDDVFNEHIGKAVALAKILDIVEQLPPDILKAVQPDEITTGHRVKIICYGSEDEVFGIGTVACKISDIMYSYDKESFEEVYETISKEYWNGEVCTPPNSIIIDDTNAQYETLEGGEK